MNKKETEVVLQRIENWYARLPDLIVFDKQNFNAEFGWSKEPTLFQDRMELKYKKIEEGESWGEKWESAWFHLTGEVPKNWSGKQVATDLDFSGEGLVFDSDGVAIQGITNGAIWDQNFARTRVPFIDECSGGEKIELWVEAAANSLFGVFTEPDPEEQSPKRYGWFDAKVEKMKFGIFDNDVWHLYLDARILLGLVKHLDKKSVRRIRIIKSLNQCINVFAENRSNAQASRDCLKVELEKCASASDLKVSAIGHAHIDTGWLWPVRETVRKTARTFATQLKIIEQYPQYIFGASQPQHYQFMKDSYPEIYERVKAAVKSGNWECQGGMWVEADCNLISGESMVRQLLHGKNFFKNEFDVDVDNLWLPDVFGYSAALPQILKKSGVNFFLTQKLSWSQFNEFPHQTFHWRGIDGTEILTHFPPENTYNSELDTQFLLPAQSGFKEKDKLDEFISLFGVGDGGGGPKPENIELGIRMKDLENSPRVRFDTAKNFFHRLEKEKDSLDTWVGELYLELHRGTLTTHGLVKKQNRKLEWKLRAVEMLWSCADLDKYPAKELDAMWKKLLINQFHDIIPGSSINMVYQTTHKEYEEIHKGCDDLIDQSANILFQEDKNAFVLMNSLSYKWEGMVTLPESLNGYELLNENGERVKVQKIGEKIEAFVSLNPLSFSTFRKGEKSNIEELTDNGLILENELIRYEFNDQGKMISAFDKEIGKEVINDGGNVLSLYEDRPNNWDAWDIDFFYRDALLETAVASSKPSALKGGISKQIEFTFNIADSNIVQKIVLQPKSKRIDFQTKVDWKEKHKMLRVHFPVTVMSDQATFDIQYGYVKRNSHRNTSWDKAKFEVVGHKYADLSDHDYGVGLLNDCKYGYMVHDNLLDLNLLRSPSNPDPDADMGEHEFTYSLFPHKHDLIRSSVITESTCLNQGPIMFEGVSSDLEIPIKLSGQGLELSVLKKAEKEDCCIIRIVETHGRNSKGVLQFKGSINECNLIEWENLDKKENVQGEFLIDFSPFEIKTYKIHFSN